MTPEEIRAEAVERLAKAIWWMRSDREVPCPWEDANEAQLWAYRHRAGKYVDALGDMLPTEAWWALTWTNKYGEQDRQTDSIESREDAERFRDDYAERFPEIATSLRVERRYISDWQEVTE